MTASLFTYLLFISSIIVGAITFALSARSRLGEKIPPLLRWPLRLSFGIVVFLAVWSTTSYALWAMGVTLTIGMIERGIMGEHWWLGPACIVYAAFIYAQLKRNS